MRLFTKYFLFGMLLFGLAISLSGYFLLHYSMESSMAREADFALKQYQYDKFTVQSALLSYTDVSVVVDMEESFSDAGQTLAVRQAEPMGSLFGILAEEISVPAAFYSEEGTLLYSEIGDLDPGFLEGLSEEAHVYQFLDRPEGSSILVGSVLKYDKTVLPEVTWSFWKEDQDQTREGEVWVEMPEEQVAAQIEEAQGKVCFVTQWDITKAIQKQEIMRQYFVRCYLGAMAAGMVLMGMLSAFLTRPLKRMSRAARRMAEGYYEERLAMSGRDEIGELAESFNQMAGAVEDKIGELSRAAREKEDFVANFAHELKTPLTSIIGYADTLYQKELSREEIRKASWHIWNEGMRLESLSFKLMELTVLGRQTFPLEEMPGEELLKDAAEGLGPFLAEKQVDLCLEAQAAYVMVDYDLLKTLLINLVDNSVKAGSSKITLQGKEEAGSYRISVRDNGCGMEEEALSRITEAFYMVDKARSRKQHGAGLGLALADRIARIHGSSLQFQSSRGAGTEVTFCLKCAQEEEADKDE